MAQQDPNARKLDAGNYEGSTLTGGPKMLLRFTCTHESCVDNPAHSEPTTKIISKGSYEKGIVVVRCQHCDNQHLIADRLGWFGDRTDIEQILAERGEEVSRLLADDVQGGESLLHIDR